MTTNGPGPADEFIGVCHLFSETGTEGGYWAFQDGRHITENTTRFACAKCGSYWDKAQRPDGPYTDELPDKKNMSGEPFCPPGTHDFQLVSKHDWSYEGLHVLKDGDRLTIYDKDEPNKVVWSGVIALTQLPFNSHASGWRIHADQQGIDRDTWSKWFFGEYPAKLVKHG